MEGTAAYEAAAGLPELVAAAVAAANREGFGNSCLPEQGELLRLLARGVGQGAIGETGAGCGVGLGWLASGAHPGSRIVGAVASRDRRTVEPVSESRVQIAWPSSANAVATRSAGEASTANS